MKVLLVANCNATSDSLLATFDRFISVSCIPFSKLLSGMQNLSVLEESDKAIVWSGSRAIEGVASAITLRTKFQFDGPILVGCTSAEQVSAIPARILASDWLQDLGIEIEIASRILGKVLSRHVLKSRPIPRECRPVWSLIIEQPTLLHDVNSVIRDLGMSIREFEKTLSGEDESNCELLSRLKASQSKLQRYNGILREMLSFD